MTDKLLSPDHSQQSTSIKISELIRISLKVEQNQTFLLIKTEKSIFLHS